MWYLHGAKIVLVKACMFLDGYTHGLSVRFGIAGIPSPRFSCLASRKAEVITGHVLSQFLEPACTSVPA